MEMLLKMMEKESTGIPTTHRSSAWLQKAGKSVTYFSSDDSSGKWCIVLNESEVDQAWEKIKKACDNDLFVLCKVSTRMQLENSDRKTYLICVYTTDWKNTEDVYAKRKVLSDLGFTTPLKYKKDSQTRMRVYGTDDEFYIVEK